MPAPSNLHLKEYSTQFKFSGVSNTQAGGLKGGSEMLLLALLHWMSTLTVIFHIKVNVDN